MLAEPATSGKTSVMVAQPHGGALKPGGDGVSGGRKPSKVLAVLSRVNEKSAIQLEKLLDDPGENLSPAELVAAMDKSGKYVHAQKTIVVTIEAQQAIKELSLATADFFSEIGHPEMFDDWVEHCRQNAKDV